MPRASGGRTVMTVRRRSASVSTATAITSNNPVYASSVWNATSSTGTGQTLFGRRRRNPHRRAVGCRMPGRFVPMLKLTLGGRLETWQALDGFNLNTVADRSAGDHHIDRRRQSARTQLHQFLAEGVAVLRSEQGLEHHRQFRRSLSLSDRHRALPEHHGQRRGDLRQSDS